MGIGTAQAEGAGQMNKDRLLKLADFLETLPDEKFDFRKYVKKDDGLCGTVCCAIGWCPAVFPNEWYWERCPDADWVVVVLRKGFRDIGLAGMEFFDVSIGDYERMFIPLSTRHRSRPGSGLPSTATAKRVAAGIREFVAEKEATQ